MKKLLILGGINLHSKIVAAAKKMGVFTGVVDYLQPEDSPAKTLSDAHYEINVFDVDKIVELCKKEKYTAVLNSHIDPCQFPYFSICHSLNCPCYIDSKEQIESLTDKKRFKEKLVENGLDIIKTYSEEEIKSNHLDYPVLVKPGYSRGSRGQAICYNYDELKAALKVAENISFNHDYIVEQYMGNCDDFTMTYFFIDGECYLIRTADRILGDLSNGLEKVAMAELTPSHHQKLYIDKVHSKVVNMLIGLGIKNGPVFMQGFVDGNTIRFYDPAFRNPGVEFNLMLKETTGIDLDKMLVEFAVEGNISTRLTDEEQSKMLRLNDHFAIELFPCIKPGKIKSILGIEEIKNMNGVVFVSMRHRVGDVIEFYGNANQRLCEIDVVASSLEELKSSILRIQKVLHVLDEENNEMIFNPLRVELLKE